MPLQPDLGAPGVRPEHLAPVSMAQLAALCGAASEGPPRSVTGITAASSTARPGDLFAALAGRDTHGARHATEAIAAGAVGVLTDAAGRRYLPAGTPTLTVPDVRACLGTVSAAVYGNPSRELSVLGVTGTSGKTTTTFLLRAGLQAAGRRCGLIGTVASYIADEVVKTGFTTPEAPDLQALLAVMRERGLRDVAMEVSSHALALGRVAGIDYAVTAFTNLSQDHLDFHTDMEHYFAAKASLFDAPGWPVVVVDDQWGRRLAEQLSGCTTVSTQPGVAADWTAHHITLAADGHSTFLVTTPSGAQLTAGSSMPGWFNVANVVLALAILDRVGVAAADAVPALASAQVPGRMERVEAGQPFLAVVDYSHKPAAVRAALQALRPLTAGRLTVVLGSGGDRDRAKRPLMGEIAAREADMLIITDDNPRSEDPAAIRAEMLVGARGVPAEQRGEVREVGDRAEAIAEALAAARPGDTVLVAGKGHEQGQEIAGVLYPFDDRDVVRDALARLRS